MAATRSKWNDLGLLRRFIGSIQIPVRYKYYRRGERKPKDLSWITPIAERHEKIKKGEINLNPEPAKLHMVWRVKGLKGRPYWEKNIVKEFGLDEKAFKRQIVKNTPYVNHKLMTIKHLIKIVPVTFPYGLPESESDYEHCYIKDNGEFIVKRKVDPLPEGIELEKEPEDSVWKMDKDTLVRHCEQKLKDFDLNAEYFDPKYVYKYNQDGKEYRYFGDKSMDGKRDWF